ncbi:hypothetical protein ACWCQV_22515, partial [Streptomyces eurythermus]
ARGRDAALNAAAEEAGRHAVATARAAGWLDRPVQRPNDRTDRTGSPAGRPNPPDRITGRTTEPTGPGPVIVLTGPGPTAGSTVWSD